MSFKITFEPLDNIASVKPTTFEIETAAKAWLEAEWLMKSDERVTICEDGHTISWEELRDRASREAS